MPKPNLLLIILDTTRRDRLSLYGHNREMTPALDRFARDGQVYTRAIAPSHWTIPSHASMFTGMYPGAHGVTQASSRLAADQPTLAEIVREEGYHTVAFCNNPLVGVINHGLARGFDYFYNYASAVPQRPSDNRKPWLRREVSRRFRPTARRIGNWFAQNDELFRLSLNPLLVPVWSRYINFKGNTANSIGDLKDYWVAYTVGGQNKPLFAFLNLMGAHLPYRPPLEMLDRVAPRLRHDKQVMAFIRRFNADGAGWASPPEPPLTDWQQAALLDFYDAEIAEQDAQLGYLLDYLERSGALDNTTVVIAADHGEGHGEHHLFGHGFDVYQELVHVPLIIRGERFMPGIEADVRSTRRLFHTFVEAAGAEMTAERLGGLESREQAATFSLAADHAGEQTVFTEAYPPLTFVHVLEHRNPGVIERMGLREVRRAAYQDDDKVVVSGEGEAMRPVALYDVARDPSETRNLIANDPVKVAERTSQLRTFAQGTMVEGGDAGTHHPFSPLEDDPEVLEHLRALGYIE